MWWTSLARFWTIVGCMLLLTSVLASANGREDGTLRVVTYNIRHGLGMDGVLDLERIGAVLLAIRPDVVALNEVDQGLLRSRRVDQARALAEQLGMHYAFGPNLRFLGGAYGNAILSRFPIRSYENVHLKAKGREQRGLLHAVLHVDGAPLHVLTTHLEVRLPEIRDAQITEIAEYVRLLDGPVVLMGDFNSDAGMPKLAEKLSSILQDAWVVQRHYFPEAVGISDGASQVGSPTFPSRSPTKRIDYIFVSDHLLPTGPRSVRTVASDASDHLPLVADLKLTAEPYVTVLGPGGT